MKTVKQNIMVCRKCKSNTLHYKNGKRINWLLHIFLLIITAGLWLIPFLLIIFLGMNIWDSNRWICSSCGQAS